MSIADRWLEAGPTTAEAARTKARTLYVLASVQVVLGAVVLLMLFIQRIVWDDVSPTGWIVPMLVLFNAGLSYASALDLRQTYRRLQGGRP